MGAHNNRVNARATEVRTFAFGPGLNIEQAAGTFRRDGHVRLVGFLAEPDGLRDHLTQRRDWTQVINSGAKVFELDRAMRAAMPPAKADALDAAVYKGAAAGFQYRFENIRVPDDEGGREKEPTMLNRFASWMSGGGVRAALRAICGTQAIDFADAQATLFSAGDFLTGHDDAVPGKNRHAAYVLGLTPRWRIEWGGMLMFHDPEGASVTGMMPGFNTLDLFAVPQMHSVSLVSPAAPFARLSITGWLRSHDG